MTLEQLYRELLKLNIEYNTQFKKHESTLMDIRIKANAACRSAGFDIPVNNKDGIDTALGQLEHHLARKYLDTIKIMIRSNMSNIKRVFKTPKGTEIPLLNLKGKEYLQVAHRLIILDETYESYTVNTELIQVSDVSAVSKATIIVFDKNTGKVLRSVTSTKRETQKDFPDFIEKAETGSIGRALALIGIGTQFCTQDMDEGMRLADSPVFLVKKLDLFQRMNQNKQCRISKQLL